MTTSSSPGNVFFFGEHSVVYERPAIVSAIGLRTYATVRPRSDGKIIIESHGYGRSDETVSTLRDRDFTSYHDGMDPLIDLISGYGLKSGVDISIVSKIPKESGGMSSSTAVLCALKRVMDRYTETDSDYFVTLFPIQERIHGGSASGAEIASSSLGGYNRVRVDKSGEFPSLERENLGSEEYRLVIGNTSVESKTREAVQMVRNLWESDKPRYEKSFDRIAEIVTASEGLLLSGDLEGIGRLMDENQRILSVDLHVSHPRLDRLLKAAREAGAYGAKLSGGGMGGIMIALVDEDRLKSVASAIEEADGEPYLTSIGVEGIRDEF